MSTELGMTTCSTTGNICRYCGEWVRANEMHSCVEMQMNIHWGDHA